MTPDPGEVVRHTFLPRKVRKGRGLPYGKNPYGRTPGELVEVLWLDAVSVGTDVWLESTEATQSTPEPSVAVGYLWDETETHLTVVALVNTRHVGHGITIPRGCVVEVRRCH
jgi:hypothetical protein